MPDFPHPPTHVLARFGLSFRFAPTINFVPFPSCLPKRDASAEPGPSPSLTQLFRRWGCDLAVAHDLTAVFAPRHSAASCCMNFSGWATPDADWRRVVGALHGMKHMSVAHPMVGSIFVVQTRPVCPIRTVQRVLMSRNPPFSCYPNPALPHWCSTLCAKDDSFGKNKASKHESTGWAWVSPVHLSGPGKSNWRENRMAPASRTTD